MEISEFKSVYLIGAGGSGMSALVRFFLAAGKNVAGYDRTPSAITQALMDEGAQIHFEDNVELIPQCCRDSASALVVYTPAIPAEHTEMKWFRENGFDIRKRAQVLGDLTVSMEGICVAGTHGKTTTSAMTAHILDGTPDGCNAFLGGIAKNTRSNLLLSDRSDRVVIEADEFDRSFHWLRPQRTVITAMDADHLDIYGTYENYIESFRHYMTLVKPGGDLILNVNVARHAEGVKLADGVHVWTYGMEKGDFHAENVRMGNGEIRIDFISPLGNIRDVELGVPVKINIENGVAAMALSQLSGATEEEILKGMASFSGTDRRFDFHLKTDAKVYLSDYAHHPAELKQCAVSVRELYADRRITAIFQPHLYTRTRDFYKEFAESLSLFDEVWLLEIYPAREKPIPGVTSQLLADNIRPGVCRGIVSMAEVPDLIKRLAPDVEVLVTAGAGDLDNYADMIARELEQYVK